MSRSVYAAFLVALLLAPLRPGRAFAQEETEQADRTGRSRAAARPRTSKPGGMQEDPSPARNRRSMLLELRSYADTITFPAAYEREKFVYTRYGRPDPLAPPPSIAHKNEEMPALILMAIIYDAAAPGRSIAIIRIGDRKGEQRRVSPGDKIGQIEIESIEPKKVNLKIRTLGNPKTQVLTLSSQTDKKK